MTHEIDKDWWKEEYGFFGEFYMKGDDSIEGYRVEEKQSLDERTRVEVDGVLSLLNLKSDSKIFDCPCGYGRHSIGLAEKGMNVLGVDLNKKHLSVALDKLAGSENLRFGQGNMLTLDY